MLPTKFAFVDIETTGSRMTHDRIIEIGVLVYEKDKIVKTYKTLLNPQTYVSSFIEDMTGINARELESAPLFVDIKDTLLEILGDCVFVAHNVRFDYGFIRNEFRRCEVTYSAKQLCTVKLSRALYPEFPRHNLDSIIQRFDFQCENRHRAYDDAEVIYKFFLKARDLFPPDQFEAALKNTLRLPSVPINLPTGVTEKLPESPGVYIFYGEEGIPLYIGKSINIRDRVLSHFSSDYTSTKEMNLSQQVKSIETTQTAGELSALFLESHLIKTMQPVYNRKLRTSYKIYMLKKTTNADGFYSADLEEATVIGPDDIEAILAIFKSQAQAKKFIKYISKEYLLCEKIFGTEKGPRACFGYQIDTCNGACVGEEDCDTYNVRFVQAFADSQVRPWPYKGPILIKEQHATASKGEAYIVDKWCLCGKITFGEEGVQDIEESEFVFDYDTYKILNRFLKEPSYQRKISPLPPELQGEFVYAKN